MRPTIKDVNFHFSNAHRANFFFAITEKNLKSPFHFTEETLIFWFSGSANFSLPFTIEITMGTFVSKIFFFKFLVSELYPMLKDSLDCASKLML